MAMSLTWLSWYSWLTHEHPSRWQDMQLPASALEGMHRFFLRLHSQQLVVPLRTFPLFSSW